MNRAIHLMTRTPTCTRVSLLVVMFLHLSEKAPGQSLPDVVVSVLNEYASLDPVSFFWDGTTTLYASGSRYTYSVKSEYVRHNRHFAWSRLEKALQPPGVDAQINSQLCRFNGEVLASAHGKLDASWYSISALVETQPKERYFQLPYLDAVGIYCPTQQEDLPKGVLQSQILYLIQNGANVVSYEDTELEGTAIVRVELLADNPDWEGTIASDNRELEYEAKRLNAKDISQSDFDKIARMRDGRKRNMPRQLRWSYYLAPDHRFAVIKHERHTMDGRLIASYSNASFRAIPGTSIVLAGEIRLNVFQAVGATGYEIMSAPVDITEISLSKASTEPIPLERFVLKRDEVAPGARVIDAVTAELQRSNGTVVSYVMPASPDDLDAAIAAASGKRLSDSGGTYFRYGLVVINVLVLIAIAWRLYAVRRWSGRPCSWCPTACSSRCSSSPSPTCCRPDSRPSPTPGPGRWSRWAWAWPPRWRSSRSCPTCTSGGARASCACWARAAQRVQARVENWNFHWQKYYFYKGDPPEADARHEGPAHLHLRHLPGSDAHPAGLGHQQRDVPQHADRRPAPRVLTDIPRRPGLAVG